VYTTICVDPSVGVESRLVVQSVAGGAPRVAYKSDGRISAVSVTADGSRALIVRSTKCGRPAAGSR
jgi:hypothetical protein